MLALSSPILPAAVAVAVSAVVGRFFYQGYIHRSRVRSLKAQGLPILPHSLILGHLLVLADFTRLHHPDVNIHVFHTWLIENCKKYFPGHDRPPPVVYLDLWPVSSSLAVVNDPVVASQFTISKNLPKIGMVKQYIRPLTSSIDIFCAEGAAWKTWRSILSPGFSNRNLITMVPEIVEEVAVFVDELKKTVGRSGTWGPVFQLEPKTINLTFDVICRAVLDMRLRQQSCESDTPLKTALLDQLRLMGIMTNAARATILGRMPWHTAAIANNNRVMRNILLPRIQAKFEDKVNHARKKTIIGLAVESFNKAGPQSAGRQQSGFVETLIANLKVFLFAGHDTTSSSICFMFKLLQDNPQALATLRKEHDDMFGADPEKAAQVLAVSPHLLSSLPYTLGVIKETLRLHPLAGTILPAIHRHPKYWLRADEFVPERWTVAEGDPLHPVHNAWVPFSIGARNCIGMELAMIELKLVLVLLVRTFDIEEAWDEWDTERGPKATPAHAVNGQRLYPVGISTVHPKDKMPLSRLEVQRLRRHQGSCGNVLSYVRLYNLDFIQVPTKQANLGSSSTGGRMEGLRGTRHSLHTVRNYGTELLDDRHLCAFVACISPAFDFATAIPCFRVYIFLEPLQCLSRNWCSVAPAQARARIATAFMGAIGRECSVVNLDPANDKTNYPCALDIRDLVTLEEIMTDDQLGPNGGILYAFEELEHNMEWLENGLKALEDSYILFDCPGQVELYTHHNSLRNIFFKLQKLGYRLVVVHLSDSFCLTQPSLYISNLLLTLRAMLQMDLPHINVLTKIDNVASYDPLPFNLDFYTDVEDLSYLLPELEAESPAMRSDKFSRLNQAVAQLVESFGLVRFEVLAVENKKSVMHLLRVIDRAGGYVFGGAEGANDTVWQVAMRNESSMMDVQDIQERWIDAKDEYDAAEQKEWEEQQRKASGYPVGADTGTTTPDLIPDDDDEFDGMPPPMGDSGVKVIRRNR
ncbi:hypothetical protein O1611_g2083 [Lasiodiplodia mahajangana]|uniref:Uncharacterized protein n=1 Tax=Lasiodiplodia mahajangana TaxID=1108764 RepID=A0ACC2JW47_9PEZI|nr:hypothetical protein O1611_g2083 [Lasiodiplodia mahajangana]